MDSKEEARTTTLVELVPVMVLVMVLVPVLVLIPVFMTTVPQSLVFWMVPRVLLELLERLLLELWATVLLMLLR